MSTAGRRRAPGLGADLVAEARDAAASDHARPTSGRDRGCRCRQVAWRPLSVSRHLKRFSVGLRAWRTNRATSALGAAKIVPAACSRSAAPAARSCAMLPGAPEAPCFLPPAPSDSVAGSELCGIAVGARAELPAVKVRKRFSAGSSDSRGTHPAPGPNRSSRRDHSRSGWHLRR